MWSWKSSEGTRENCSSNGKSLVYPLSSDWTFWTISFHHLYTFWIWICQNMYLLYSTIPCTVHSTSQSIWVQKGFLYFHPYLLDSFSKVFTSDLCVQVTYSTLPVFKTHSRLHSPSIWMLYSTLSPWVHAVTWDFLFLSDAASPRIIPSRLFHQVLFQFSKQLEPLLGQEGQGHSLFFVSLSDRLKSFCSYQRRGGAYKSMNSRGLGFGHVELPSTAAIDCTKHNTQWDHELIAQGHPWRSPLLNQCIENDTSHPKRVVMVNNDQWSVAVIDFCAPIGPLVKAAISCHWQSAATLK